MSDPARAPQGSGLPSLSALRKRRNSHFQPARGEHNVTRKPLRYGGLRAIPRRRVYATNADRQRAYRRRIKASVHFRSKSHLWETPDEFFALLDAEFGFALDVCATDDNAKCERYFTPKVNGLRQPWEGVCWCNPPYGREIGQWVRKAHESAQAGATVVCLLPARTDTLWWHDHVLDTAEVRFLRGRLKFGGCENSAPFPSAVVVFRPPTSARSLQGPDTDPSLS